MSKKDWTHCMFIGDPPPNYSDWCDFCEAKTKSYVTVMESTRFTGMQAKIDELESLIANSTIEWVPDKYLPLYDDIGFRYCNSG